MSEQGLWSAPDERFTSNSLYNLLESNEISDYDPVKESFKVKYVKFLTYITDTR